MNETEYLEQRLQDQIDWYDKKSASSKRWFLILRVCEAVAAASIPLLAAYSDTGSHMRLSVGILGVLVAVFAAMLGLFRFQENWSDYRFTSESLKHEKYLFLTKAVPYDGPQAFPLLVERVESLISKETSGWAQATRSLSKPKTENK